MINEYKQKINDIKKKNPEFTNYVIKINRKLNIISFIIAYIIIVISILFFNFLKTNPYIIGIFGALLLGIGNFRHTDEIIILSVTNFGYNDELAKDLILSGLFTFWGTMFVIYSLIITLF